MQIIYKAKLMFKTNNTIINKFTIIVKTYKIILIILLLLINLKKIYINIELYNFVHNLTNRLV